MQDLLSRELNGTTLIRKAPLKIYLLDLKVDRRASTESTIGE